MSAKKWASCLVVVVSAILIGTPYGQAETESQDEQPWERFGLNLGAFIMVADSSFRIGSGVGVDIDVEEALDLDVNNAAFRADAFWRFTENRRHRLDFTWFSINRDGEKTLSDDITIEVDGEEVTILEGSKIESYFDFDIYELAYSYSFLQDERIDLSVGAGLYIMPMDFGLKAAGLVNEEGNARFTAPLPVLGLRMDIALTPKWFVRCGSQVFYVEYENFRGSLMEFRGAIEYNPWEHVGFGLGFDTLGVRLDADGEDWPGVDFDGSVRFDYAGLQLYFRLFY